MLSPATSMATSSRKPRSLASSDRATKPGGGGFLAGAAWQRMKISRHLARALRAKESFID